MLTLEKIAEESWANRRETLTLGALRPNDPCRKAAIEAKAILLRSKFEALFESKLKRKPVRLKRKKGEYFALTNLYDSQRTVSKGLSNTRLINDFEGVPNDFKYFPVVMKNIETGEITMVRLTDIVFPKSLSGTTFSWRQAASKERRTATDVRLFKKIKFFDDEPERGLRTKRRIVLFGEKKTPLSVSCPTGASTPYSQFTPGGDHINNHLFIIDPFLLKAREKGPGIKIATENFFSSYIKEELLAGSVFKINRSRWRRTIFSNQTIEVEGVFGPAKGHRFTTKSYVLGLNYIRPKSTKNYSEFEESLIVKDPDGAIAAYFGIDVNRYKKNKASFNSLYYDAPQLEDPTPLPF